MLTWKNISFSNTTDQAVKVVQLSHYRLFKISGPDAAQFLQGQLTNDIDKLQIGKSLLTAHCNPKGRMISSFWITKRDDEEYLLRIHESIAEAGLNALKKYMVFSKATLEPIENSICVALINTNSVDVTNETHKIHSSEISALSSITHSETCTEFWLNDNQLEENASIFSQYTLGDIDDWHLWQIQSGIADITSESSEKYLPQELNYDLLGAVNFKKGCYTGQEVIARLHYKGKVKKRLRYGQCDTRHALQAQQKIFDIQTEKACGEIVHIITTNQEKQYFLAISDNQSATENTCVTNLSDPTKIQWPPLPYAIT